MRHSLSPLLAALMSKSISTGIYPHLLKRAKVITVYKTATKPIPVITTQFPYFRSSIDCLRNLCINAFDHFTKRMAYFLVLNMDLATIAARQQLLHRRVRVLSLLLQATLLPTHSRTSFLPFICRLLEIISAARQQSTSHSTFSLIE